MATHVFLSGHGGWSPRDGWVMVPKGCRIHFYTHFAKNMITGMEYMILSGQYTDIDRTIEEYKQCPNMVLSHQEDSWTQKSLEKLQVRNDIQWSLITPPNGRFRLGQIFDYWSTRNEEAEFHWMACQTLSLKQVGGRKFGLNAGDFSHDTSMPGKYRVTTQGSNGSVISWL
jgi:hypothetical protein